MFLPLNLTVEQRLCVIIGAGAVAERKCRKLLEHGASVRIVAMETRSCDLWRHERVELIKHSYDRQFLCGALLAIAATDAPGINAQVAADAREMGILVLRADSPADSDFTLPATLRRGYFTVSFGTDGRLPALSSHLRAEAEQRFGREYGDLCRIAESLQNEPAWQSLTSIERQAALRRFAGSSALDWLRQGDEAKARKEARAALSDPRACSAGGGFGRVFLVGAGPGDPGLISMKGAACLRKATVVVHDALANPALLELCSDGAERLNVGKRKGCHLHMQPEINALLIDYARRGNTVVRLKGGDPTIFGRGGEEARALAAAGIPFEIVPGVSSISAVPAYAGIPITDREYGASSFGVYSLHLRGGRRLSDEQWHKMADGPDTLVLLMGISALDEIVEQLTRHGRPASTPIAIILEGTTPRQRLIIATLGTILEQLRETPLEGPGLIVVGNVVLAAGQMQWTPQECSQR
jgi:uroporphyrin-III C-methyltransferase/precorrin-2 dehydrogenase/sirohydrochlorin ferrochelatase